MRDVEMSPDGSFFVVATTGGPHSGTLCDTAARFETYAVGTALTPTWTDTSGGDTLWGVEVTQSAVYVGGHNRWMNNPNGSDRAAQGAVPRPGPGRPSTRRPASRSSGTRAATRAVRRRTRSTRPTPASGSSATPTGSATAATSARGIAFFPYSEGYNTASKSTGSLPGNVYVGAPLAGSNVLYRVNAGGAAIASVDNGPDWVVRQRRHQHLPQHRQHRRRP